MDDSHIEQKRPGSYTYEVLEHTDESVVIEICTVTACLRGELTEKGCKGIFWNEGRSSTVECGYVGVHIVEIHHTHEIRAFYYIIILHKEENRGGRNSWYNTFCDIVPCVFIFLQPG